MRSEAPRSSHRIRSAFAHLLLAGVVGTPSCLFLSSSSFELLGQALVPRFQHAASSSPFVAQLVHASLRSPAPPYAIGNATRHCDFATSDLMKSSIDALNSAA